MAQAQATRPELPTNAIQDPRKPTLGRDIPSTLVSRSPERSTQPRGPDSDFFPGDTPGPVLWTTSPPKVRPASPCPPGRLPPSRGPRSPAVRTSAPVKAAPGVRAQRGTPGHILSDSLLPDLQNRLPCPRSPDHALDFSLLFKSPPREGGKKYPEEIRVNRKEKTFKRVSTAAKKVTY